MHEISIVTEIKKNINIYIYIYIYPRFNNKCILSSIYPKLDGNHAYLSDILNYLI